jgi:hypothetical protein
MNINKIIKKWGFLRFLEPEFLQGRAYRPVNRPKVFIEIG